MNEHVDFERLVAGHIADEGATPPSEAFYDELFTRAARKGPRPEWLALIKESPMRSNSRVTVGSPTVRVVAILAATMLLAVALAAAGAGVQRLLAAGPLVVAQDGSGDYTTIAEAISVAEPGDIVQVRPGDYVEAVVVDKDITLQGDGDRASITLTAPDDGPTSPTGIVAAWESVDDPYSLLVSESDALISGITFTGDRSAVHVLGGSPTLEDLHFMELGGLDPGDDSSLVLTGGTTALVRANTFEGGGNVRVYDQSAPIIEDNLIVDGPTLAGNFGDAAIVRNNTIRKPLGNGIAVTNPSSVLIEGNTLELVPGYAFALFDPAAQVRSAGGNVETYRPVYRDNQVIGGMNGLQGLPGGEHVLEGNRFTDLSGVAIAIESDVTATGNVMTGHGTGLMITDGAPRITDNDVSDGTVGIVVFAAADAVFSGNTACGNETNLRLVGEAEAPGGDNEICEDEVSE